MYNALFRERMVMCRVTPAKPVKECLEAFRHVRPVDRADPDDSVRFPQRTADFREIVPDDAGTRLVAGAPAVAAGTAVFEFLLIQMDFPNLSAGLRQAANDLILRGGRQAVPIRA